jgi:hypothetical protein
MQKMLKHVVIELFAAQGEHHVRGLRLPKLVLKHKGAGDAQGQELLDDLFPDLLIRGRFKDRNAFTE